MKHHIIAIGTRIPAWVNQGINEYQKRFKKPDSLHIHELPAVKRTPRNHLDACIAQESQALLQATDKIHQSKHILLDVKGRLWSTEQLAQYLDQWQHTHSQTCFLIGGADGVSQPCFDAVDHVWSFSPLTLPHPLVRVMLVEQLYRATMILKDHPYHRS